MPTITLFFAAAAVLVNFWLGMRCGQVRMAEKINHGDGGNALLQRRMRAQLNFAENTPLILILFGALELAGANDMFLAIVAPVYIIARICHALGMDPDSSPLRGIGIMITMLTAVVLAAYAIYTGYTLYTAADMPAAIGAAV